MTISDRRAGPLGNRGGSQFTVRPRGSDQTQGDGGGGHGPITSWLDQAFFLGMGGQLFLCFVGVMPRKGITTQEGVRVLGNVFKIAAGGLIVKSLRKGGKFTTRSYMSVSCRRMGGKSDLAWKTKGNAFNRILHEAWPMGEGGAKHREDSLGTRREKIR